MSARGVEGGLAILALALILVIQGCTSAPATRSGSSPPTINSSAPKVSVREGQVVDAIDGNTIVLRDRGDAIYFSSRLATKLTAMERNELFGPRIGREVATEGSFLAITPSAPGKDRITGIAAATTDRTSNAIGLVLVQTYASDDRVIDLASRPRLYMSLSLTGTGEHVSCAATPWLPIESKATVGAFVSERCEIRRGRIFPVGAENGAPLLVETTHPPA